MLRSIAALPACDSPRARRRCDASRSMRPPRNRSSAPILRDARTVTYEFVERVGMRALQDEGGTQQRAPHEQHRPVIASATRSSSLSFSCAWSCACGWGEAGGGTPVSAIGSSCGSPCRPHLDAARRGRRRVDGVAAGREYRAIKRLGRALADIAAAHVARETFEVALERRAEAAAAAGAQDIGIARVQNLVERLAVVEALFLSGGETVDRDRIAASAEPALEAPWLALHPIHLRVETKVVARLHHLLAPEPAADAAGAARVRPQRVA